MIYTKGLGQTAPAVVVSTNPSVAPAPSFLTTYKIPILLALAAAIAAYFFMGKKKREGSASPSTPSEPSVPTTSNPKRKKKGKRYTWGGGGTITLTPNARRLRAARRKKRKNPYEGFEKVRRSVVSKAARSGYPLQDRSGRAIAATIGRRKYGKKKFQAMALAGRRRRRKLRH